MNIQFNLNCAMDAANKVHQIDSLTYFAIDENADVHSMPCKIDYDGVAKVEQYFKPGIMVSRDQRINDKEQKVLKASFRGRPLNGRTLRLPCDYVGLVLKEANHSPEDNDGCKFDVTHKFHELTHWNLDKVPSTDDKIIGVMQWIDIAKAVS